MSDRTYTKPPVNVLHLALRKLPIEQQYGIVSQLCRAEKTVLHDPVIQAWIEDNAHGVAMITRMIGKD